MGFIGAYFQAMLAILCLCLVAWLFTNPVGWVILLVAAGVWLANRNKRGGGST